MAMALMSRNGVPHEMELPHVLERLPRKVTGASYKSIPNLVPDLDAGAEIGLKVFAA